MACLEVPMSCEAFGEQLVGNFSRLGQIVHSLGYLDVNVVVVDERVQFVCGHDFVRDLADVEAHVFRALHRRVQVEIFNVHAHEACVGR